jgi:hypothetical protein
MGRWPAVKVGLGCKSAKIRGLHEHRIKEIFLASAYTPGLTVSGNIVIRRTRRLPLKGDVLVTTGAAVKPDQVVARALIPGILQTIKMAEKLGVEARDVPSIFKLKPGDPVGKSQIVAETKGLFGSKFGRTQVVSEYDGTIESISEVTGNVLIREASVPVELKAYIDGTIVDVMEHEGVVVETRGAMVQGIFGVGGERQGVIRLAVGSPDEVLDAKHILDSDSGKVLIGGAGITYEAMSRASVVGARGLVAGGIRDSDLMKFLGYDIGVAITGQEAIDISVVVTEGFGYLAMAKRSFELLKGLQGRAASLNGATQIRAGVIRPEVIVPLPELAPDAHVGTDAFELKVGTPVRIIREPYFGLLGQVTGLPASLVTLESGTQVRVLEAELLDGRTVSVPRANVEIIAEG